MAGAKAVRPDIQIDVKYLGPDGDDTVWNVPDKAKEIAKSWYAGGTDVIFSAAGGSGAGTIEAAVEPTMPRPRSGPSASTRTSICRPPLISRRCC